MKQDLIKNTLIIGVGRVATQFMGLLLLPLYTHFLSPSEYGTADLIITYGALALPLITLGLEQGAFRQIVDARSDKKLITEVTSFITKVVLSLSLLSSVVVVIAGVAAGVDGSLMLVAVSYILSMAMLHVSQWFTRGFGNNMAYSIAGVIVGATSLSLNVILIAVLGFGLTGMMISLVLANIAGVAYLSRVLNIATYIQLGVSNPVVNKELLSYSLPLIPNSLSWWVISAADRTLITLFLGVAATGVFAVAAKFPAVLVGIFSIFWITWHESASIYIDHVDRDAFFSKVANTSLMLFGSIALALVAVMPIIFQLVIEVEFHQAYLYVPILMLGALCHTMITLYGSIYAAKKTTKQILNTTLLSAMINVTVLLALINFIGLYAAAISTLLAYFVMVVYRHYDIRKYVTIKLDKINIAILTLAMILVGVLYYLDDIRLTVLNVLFAGAFGLYMNKNILYSIKELLWERMIKS